MKKTLKICLLIAAALFTAPKLHAQISIGISISANIAPPALPVYVQPACPTDGYLWVPGYWAYDNDAGDYYWVPGVWIAPPNPGLLWTPAYWGFYNGAYGFHSGYWGPHVGFYGGINYGFGYGGVGFGGGQWSGNSFRYNTAVVNVNTTVVHNTYIDRTVIVNNTTVNNHTSFNGPGGVTAQPRPEELAAAREQHIPATSQQVSHESTARSDVNQHTSHNHGAPATTAMNHVGGSHFTSQGSRAPRTNTAAQHTQAQKPTGDNAAVRPQDNDAKPQTDAAKPAQQKQQQHAQHSQPQPQQHRQPQQQHHAQARAPKPHPAQNKKHE